MSFLAPLYALGFLAIAGPIVFHLIRRRPKGEVPFSSLMFLTPSPPPPTSRRRLDQLLLLLLRAAVLALLGLAFMRPFLRQDLPTDAVAATRQVVVLIDTSASMRRGDLWTKAVAKAEAALAECRPTDHIALYAFDRTTHIVFGFDESDRLEPSLRLAVARDRLNGLKPTWAGTALDRALIDSVGAILENLADGPAAKGKVILVSDLPSGARLTELNGFEWPKDVELELRTVTDERANAGLSLVFDRTESEAAKGTGPLRVRVTNEAGAKREQFQLTWAGIEAPATEAYVPPGESRVVKVPRPPAGAAPTSLKLRGDDHEFDNTLFVAMPTRQEQSVFVLSDDAATDPNGLVYFLERAWDETADRGVRVVVRKLGNAVTADEVRPSPLVVLAGMPVAATTPILDQYVREGGTLLLVLTAPGPLPALTGVSSKAVEEAGAARNGYAMLRDIAFDHPLFSPLSGPQFGDFTKVQFWKHRRVTDQHLPGARVLARFDDGNPAILEKTVDRGRLMLFAAGWQPADSQLARSSKFVPLMSALLELRGGRAPAVSQYRVGDRIALNPKSGTTGVRTPEGTVVPLAPDAEWFEGTDRPGLYAFETPAGPRPFAVNLDPAESVTAPLAAETLEQFGCRLSSRAAAEDPSETERQQRNAELERRQSIWRVLILTALAVLLVETGLAGWRTRSVPQEGETP